MDLIFKQYTLEDLIELSGFSRMISFQYLCQYEPV